MARFSATAASASRPRALRGGVEESLGRLARPGSPAGPAKAAAASRLRSEGSPGGAGFSRVTAALPSPLCPLEPSAMKSPGGGCAARGQGDSRDSTDPRPPETPPDPTPPRAGRSPPGLTGGFGHGAGPPHGRRLRTVHGASDRGPPRPPPICRRHPEAEVLRRDPPSPPLPPRRDGAALPAPRRRTAPPGGWRARRRGEL